MTCELDRIAHQVEQNLPQPFGIRLYPGGHVSGDIAVQLERLGVRARSDGSEHSLDDRTQVGGCGRQPQPARLAAFTLVMLTERLILVVLPNRFTLPVTFGRTTFAGAL